MQMLKSLKTGAYRALCLWKGILIVWLFSLLPAAIFVTPMRGALKTGLGDSLITERLAEGIDIEVFADLGNYMSGIVSYFFSGFFLVVMAGFVLNVFFAGGLFGGLRESAGRIRLSDFFKESARNFWPFLVITILINLMIIGLAIILILIPVSVIMQSETLSEGAAYRSGMILTGVFLLLMPLFVLVADYSRAWQATQERQSCFKAIGEGFTLTFRNILRSWPMMVVLLLFQILLSAMILKFVPEIRPASGSGVFLLFLLSQALFITRMLLRTWRYGTVTAFMENYAGGISTISQKKQMPVEPEQLFLQPQDQVEY